MLKTRQLSLRQPLLKRGVGLQGSVVRIGPSSPSYDTDTALKQIHGTNAANVQKAKFYLTLDAVASALSTYAKIDRQKHAFRRNVPVHAFSDNAAKSAEDFTLQNKRTLCRALGPTEKDAWPDGWMFEG